MQVMWAASPLGKIHCICCRDGGLPISLVIGGGVADRRRHRNQPHGVQARRRIPTELSDDDRRRYDRVRGGKRDGLYREMLRRTARRSRPCAPQLGQLQALKTKSRAFATPRGQRTNARSSPDNPRRAWVDRHSALRRTMRKHNDPEALGALAADVAFARWQLEPASPSRSITPGRLGHGTCSV